MLKKYRLEDCPYINNLSSDELNNGIYYEDLKYIMFGDENLKLSIKTKKYIYYLVRISLPLMFLISLLASSNRTYYHCNYEDSRYLMVKYTYFSIFFIGYGIDKGGYLIYFFVLTMSIVVFFYLYYTVEKNMIISEVTRRFNKSYKLSKLLTLIMGITGILVSLLLLSVTFYRLNRWWLSDYVNSQPVINEPVLDNLIGIFIEILMLLSITLIPTFFLYDAKSYVIANVVKNNAEDFRERYNYSKKEWYGN